MGLGFLGSVLKRKGSGQPAAPAAKAEKASLKAADVAGWLEREFPERAAGEREKLSGLASDAKSMVDDFRRNVGRIRKKEFEHGDRTYAAVNMIKDTWAKKAMLSFSSYAESAGKLDASAGGITFTAFSTLYKDTMKLLNETGMVPKQKMVLERYFEDESRKMGEILKSLRATLQEMGAAVSEPGVLRCEEKVEGTASRIKEKAIEKEGLQSSLSGVEKQMKSNKSERAGLQEKREGVTKSPAWKELDTLDRERDAYIKEKDGIEAEVSSRLGNLKRVFKLFSHESQSLTKDERRLLESLSHSPLKAFMSAEPDALERLLARTLAECRKERLSAKDASKAESIAPLISTGFLRKSRARLSTIAERMTGIEKRRSEIDVVSEKKHVERVLETAGMEAESLHRHETELKEKITAADAEITRLKKALEEHVRKELQRDIEVA